jgi:hypothetical protein
VVVGGVLAEGLTAKLPGKLGCSHHIIHIRVLWLVVAKVTTNPVAIGYSNAFADVPTCSRLESSTVYVSKISKDISDFPQLAFLDTYRTMCVAPEPPFRRVLSKPGGCGSPPDFETPGVG